MDEYFFDECFSRLGTDSMKWDGSPSSGASETDVIQMWVADMDFKAAPAIMKALKSKLDEQVFGYVSVPEAFYESAISWWERRRGWKTEKDWYLAVPGVVPALSATLKALTQFEIKDGKAVEKADRGRGPEGGLPKVIVQTPAYNCFFSSIRNVDCELVENQLIYDLEGDQATWYMDFEDLERKASDPMAKILLLCNPHNPCGRVWPRQDLERVSEICRRHGVIVVSDEIHCELEMPGYRYTPIASLSPQSQANTVTLASPSKSFNIAGLQIATVITSNQEWKQLIDKVVNIHEICDVNPFGVVALQAAYNEGEPWLRALNEYIHDNYLHLLDRFTSDAPQCPVTKLEGTYLAWVDVSAIGLSSEEIAESLLANERVRISGGLTYGRDGFIRINLACPAERCSEGVERIIAGLRRLSALKITKCE